MLLLCAGSVGFSGYLFHVEHEAVWRFDVDFVNFVFDLLSPILVRVEIKAEVERSWEEGVFGCLGRFAVFYSVIRWAMFLIKY